MPLGCPVDICLNLCTWSPSSLWPLEAKREEMTQPWEQFTVTVPLQVAKELSENVYEAITACYLAAVVISRASPAAETQGGRVGRRDTTIMSSRGRGRNQALLLIHGEMLQAGCWSPS